MPGSLRKVGYDWLLFCGVIILDQASKYGELFFKIDKIGFVKIQASSNSWLAFSLKASNTAGILFSTTWLLLALCLLYRCRSGLRRLGILLMIAGGATNLLDRVIRGGVKDIFLLGSSFFNLADIVILAGGVIILLSLFGWNQPLQKSSS